MKLFGRGRSGNRLRYRVVDIALTPDEQNQVNFDVQWHAGVYSQDTGLEMSDWGKDQLRQQAIQKVLEKRDRPIGRGRSG